MKGIVLFALALCLVSSRASYAEVTEDELSIKIAQYNQQIRKLVAERDVYVLQLAVGRLERERVDTKLTKQVRDVQKRIGALRKETQLAGVSREVQLVLFQNQIKANEIADDCREYETAQAIRSTYSTFRTIANEPER
jgi:hypothetical protein